MSFKSIQPFIRSVSLSPYYWKNEYSSIAYDARLFYIYKGSGEVLLEKKSRYDVEENDLIVIPPGICYDFDAGDKPFDLFAVNFDFTQEHSDLEQMMNICFETNFEPEKVLTTIIPPPLDQVIYLKNMRSVRSRLFNMLQEFQLNNSHRWDKLSVILKDILIDVARTLDDSYTGVSDMIASLINFIHVHYSNDITYEEISQHFSYHPYYLNRRLKQETGKTISQYLQEYRITVAAQMILSSGFSLEEIAVKTGFKNASHFSARFKKHFGKTPREYKQQSFNM